VPQKASAPIVLGIDPGLAATGWAVVTNGGGGFRLLRSGTITTTARTPLPQRLAQAHGALQSIVEAWRPTVVAIEAVYSKEAAPGASFAVGASQTLAMLLAGQSGLPVVEVTASTVKKAVAGNGRAGKGAVARAVQTLLGGADGLSGHAADAAAIALAGYLVSE